MAISKEDAIALEKLIDRYGLKEIVFTLADIMQGKSHHVDENWQDTPLSKNLEWNAKLLSTTGHKVRT